MIIWELHPPLVFFLYIHFFVLVVVVIFFDILPIIPFFFPFQARKVTSA